LKRAHFIFFLTCLILALQGKAQPYYFKNYQVTNGVSSNTITCILQDKKGFMWFGTRNGLNRFDGTSFRIFRNNLSDPVSLGNNSILSLYEDAQEKLWVGTYKGIYVYDPARESFTLLKKIPSGEIRYIKGDNQNNIWIVANGSLYRYNRINQDVLVFPFEKEVTISCINLSENGTLWTATNTGSLKRYDAQKGIFQNYEVLTRPEKKLYNQIQDIYPINDTTVLVGTMNHALSFNPKTAETKNIFQKTPWVEDIQIHQILKQSDTEYWFGTESGLYIFYPQTQKAAHIQKQYNNPYSITDNVIYTFCKDKEGGTWMGTFFGGINYFSKQYNKFQKYFSQSGTNKLSGNLVHEICNDQYGNIWIGTEDAGLNKLNPATGEISYFLPGNEKGSISYRNIHGLIAQGDELWIGTYEHGLDVMNIKTRKVIRHYHTGSDSNSLKGDFIVALGKTKNGEILVGTWNGLFKYNRTKNHFSALPFFNKQVQAIHEDEKGTIWACSYGNGVYYFNPETNLGGNLRFDSSNSNSLINNYVNNLYEDSHHNFWFCTEAGLTRLEYATGKMTRYTIEDGLPDNQVFRILEDNQGTFWITTSKGLVSFDPSSKKMKTYTTTYGLLTDQFNYNSAYKAADGTLYFGSVKGMISFKPSEFIPNAFIPPVYVTNIQVNNQDVNIHTKEATLRQSITYAKSIRLPYDQSSISLDVAALSYSFPEMNQYAYKMEGLDKDWIPLKSNRRIYFSKLPPGEYTFKIKGSNNGEVWNEKETRLDIIILPPFWATWWAYLIYVIIGFVILITILRYYLLAESEKNKRKIEALEIGKEREIYNAKIEFFTNVAHEIRTPLTLIKMPLDKLLKKEAHSVETNESLQMMKKNTQRLIDLTDQLLDFRKAEANKFSLNFTRTDINDILSEIFTAFKEAAEQKNLSYKLELPRLGLQAYVDTEALKKILSNLINNAIKYASNTVQVILLPFNSEDTEFNIEIRNDGYIIPYSLKEKIFEPFYRAKETEKQSGTGIGLPLARSLAELHKGVLDLKHPQNNLNVFLLTLPIHQDNEISFHNYETPASVSNQKEMVNEEFDTLKPFLLLVEDNKEILSFIEGELKPAYNILKAYNGQEALKILQKENVQLVVSDIMMPVMDGIELCKKIKTDLQFSHIPIILLTAKNSLSSKIEGLEVGADAYIEKPFAFEHLQAQIANLLTNRNNIKEYFARSPLTHIKGIACTKADKNFLERLNNIIYENITNMELDVDQLSKMMNMSRPTLYRKIKALSDLTPNELINLSRLKKAAELLGQEYKINEVAAMVGYSLPGNFSRDFQKQFGITPTHYINSLISQQRPV
jgi:ligand-binding sensor domain-containing protein/signal transduction histidine kinase/DNA-binding response OmpR family regulator